jgi:RNA polymerase sigma factor (TIGR02999 family)
MSAFGPDVDWPVTDAIYPLVYEELKRIARYQRHDLGASATLCTTELVHEAFFKLGGTSDATWERRAHFFGAASRAMRQVLVDFARKRNAAKHGGGTQMVSLSQAGAAVELELDEILELNHALDKLNEVDERLRLLVELRFFGGLPDDEIARMLGISTRTVGRDWLKAKLFLLRELQSERGRLGLR